MMDKPAVDVSATVEYSTDKWRMDRVPWAMWFCVAGLAVVLHAGSRGVNGAVLAGVYLALLGLAFAGWAATTLIERSDYPFYVVLPIVLLIALLVAATIAVFGSVGGHPGIGRSWWSRLVDPPLHVFGWMLIYLGGGWVIYSLLRHFHPARPIVMLSPAGISFHRSWLRDLFIPWPEIQGVGHLETSNPGSPPSTNPNAIMVEIGQDFYERVIAPKRSFPAPPGSEHMFRPKGEMMQMVLNNPELVVDPEDFRMPIEARWKAFRDQSTSVPVSNGQSGTSVVYGRWSIDGTWWQAIRFVAPLVGIAVIVLHARGIWP
jgi:hypothetical protein